MTIKKQLILVDKLEELGFRTCGKSKTIFVLFNRTLQSNESEMIQQLAKNNYSIQYTLA